MSINASIFPDSEKDLSTPMYSPPESRNREQDSPIRKYMRQNNNFYLQMQQERLKKNPPNSSTPNNNGNLKQFERQLEQQPSSRTPPQVRKDATPKNNNEKIIYSKVIQQESANTYREQNAIAYEHRAKQTQMQGDRVIDKIKSFILEERPMISPKNTKRKKQPEPYPNINSNINKLYTDSQKKEANRRQKYVEKLIVKQINQVQPFKVENPVSLYLLEKKAQQNGHKPLYQRALDIAREKQQAQLQIQFEKQQEKLFQQQQEFLKYQEIKKQKYPDSGTKEKQAKFYYDIQIKEKQKNLAKQQQKFRYYQEIAKQKPFINTMSKAMFNKMVERDQLSKDFVKRTQEYKMEREKQKLKERQKLDAQYCPFAPKISEASRELAQKYYEKKKPQQQSAQKQTSKQKQLNKQIHQMSQSAMITKFPSGQKKDTHKKTNSSSVSKNKPKKAEAVQKPKKTDQIPIYNIYIPDKRRTLSCVNVGCRKL